MAKLRPAYCMLMWLMHPALHPACPHPRPPQSAVQSLEEAMAREDEAMRTLAGQVSQG